MRRHFLLLSIGVVSALLLSVAPQLTWAQKKTTSWGIVSFAKYVTISGATRVGSETCQACHADVSTNFRHAFHAQQGIECEDCHGAGSLHVENAGDTTKIVSYSQRNSRDANGACLSCHAQAESVRNWMAGPHASNSVRCTDCHSIHSYGVGPGSKTQVNVQTNLDVMTPGRVTTVEDLVPEAKVMIQPRWEANDACLRCHQTERAQMSLPYHHPLREGKMSCGDCHDPHGGPGGNNLRAANMNQLCLTCHAQYRGPFAYQHPPVTENCMLCHTAHGSPNTSLLNVSEPALCLQCHTGHHNGASLPLADRCTNCHPSIHGTDVPTPSGGSRFLDKGPSEPGLLAGDPAPAPAVMSSHPIISASSMLHSYLSHGQAYAAGAASGLLGMMASGAMPPLSGGNMFGGNMPSANTQGGNAPLQEPPATDAYAAYAVTPGSYRFINQSGFGGRVGEYDSLQESAGGDAAASYVFLPSHMTVVSRGNFLAHDDYQAASQVTVGQWAQFGFDMRSFVQQQDNYPFYAFPVLDVPPPGVALPNCQPSADCTSNLIPSQTVFGVTRRLGNAYARVKVPKLPVHLFVTGNWQARAGENQFAYLDENSFVPIPGFAQACGAQCHFQSQLQPVNYTTRTVGGGADVKLGQLLLRWKHEFSSFNDRLSFPIATFTGPFTPEADSFGYSSAFPVPPGKGPTPLHVDPGNYAIDIPSPNQFSSDSLDLNWTASPQLTFNSRVSYTRLRDLFTGYPQNSFDSDETVNWRPIDRLRVTGDYHQQNVVNNFTPFYSLYGNVSYHNHWEGLRLEYELPHGFSVEGYYRRSGITRSNAFLWPQFYSVDNTDLMAVVPSSFSNTEGIALHYQDRGRWSARTGYEFTGTHAPGYLIVPQSNNRVFADFTVAPKKWLIFSNDLSIIVQNAFPAVPLPNTPGVAPSPPPATQTFGLNIAGLPPSFQRRDRFYFETASATLPLLPEWSLGLGYSYQQNNLTTYMGFQNDSGTGYILDEPAVPYKQITQAYWGESTFTAKQHLEFNLRLTYNSARSGFRPDVNPNDAALLGNQFLISSGAFNPALFSLALNNLQFAATQISQVIVPQWIGESKASYLFPRKFEGGLVFYYGSYKDCFNPNLNGVLRTFNVYVGRSW